MKSREEIMEILEAFDPTGSFRDAGELAGCSRHTVACWVARRDAGELPDDGPQRRERMGIADLSTFSGQKERHDLAEAERCLLDALCIEDRWKVEGEFFETDFPDEPRYSATGLIRERARKALETIEREMNAETLARRRRAS